MRHCPRCEHMKPDASFRKKNMGRNIGDPEWFDLCLHCRTIQRFFNMNMLKRPKQRYEPIEPIEASAEDQELIALARREREAFEARGAPSIEACHIRDKNGRVIRNVSYKHAGSGLNASRVAS